MKFYANRCEFKDDDSKVPLRESLLVSGSDLYCFSEEKLVNFKAEINGKIQDMSCCKKIPRTTTPSQITTTEQPEDKNEAMEKEESKPETEQSATQPQLTENQIQAPQNPIDQKITLLESQNVVVSLIPDLTKTDIDDDDDAILEVNTSPVPHIKLRAQGNENNLPPLQTKKKSMSRVEVVVNSVFVKKPGNPNDIVRHCCRYSSSHYLTSSVFTFLVCFVLYVCFNCLVVFS